MIEFITSNWLLILLCVAALAVIIWRIVVFVKSPTETQISALKEWLKLAVIDAEAALGSGTGQIKLRAVYDAAIETFPWVAIVVSFDTFSGWVDEALAWMEAYLSENEAAAAYVNGSN